MAQRYATLTFPNWPRDLKIGDVLGRGAWGIVCNGELEGRPVAVKRIHELLHQGRSEEERRKVLGDFREECKKLQAMRHPHVVSFIGAFNDPKLGPILVMEKMQENLRQFLDRWKNKLPLPKQLRISLEIIRGVAYLHQQTPPLVHRDLNDKNVMFSFEGVIKIGDFGQSKLKKDLYLTSRQPGMVTFMPPEALNDDEAKYNESLDIFSVGVLMLEIGTQQEPLGNLHGIGIMREVERREKHLKVLDEDHPLRPQILLCLKDNPIERPKASDLQREVLTLVDVGPEKEVESARSEISVSRKQIQDLQAKCDSLQERLTHAVEESEARRKHEQIMVQQMNKKLLLEQNHLRELDNEKKAKHELAERCEQLQLQVNAFEEDFKAERHDRERAHGKFADREKEWMEQLENLTQERDRLIADEFILKDQLVAGKLELEARTKEAAKVSTAVKALKEDFGTVVAKRDEEIQGMTDLIRGLQLIADRHKVCFAGNRQLQHQFDATVRSNHEVQQIPSGLQGEEAAAESRVKELTMVVGQVTAENEALTLQNEIGSSFKPMSVTPTPRPRTRMSKRISMNAGDRVNELTMIVAQVTAENEALTQQNSQLMQQNELETKRKEAVKVCTAVKALKEDFGTIVAKREEEIQGMTDLVRRLPPIADRYKNLLAENRELQHQIDAVVRTKFEVQQLLSGLQVEKAAVDSRVKELTMIVSQVTAENETLTQQNSQLMQQNEIGSSFKHVSVTPTPRPRTRRPEEISMNAGRGRHAGTDLPIPKGYPPVRYPPQAVVGKSHAKAEDKVPPAQAHIYAPSEPSGKFATDPYVHRQESSVSPSTEVSLPMPLTRPGAVTPLDDSLLSVFEANQCYIGEDINSEIEHEAQRYKKGDTAVVAVPAQADDEEWPLDPNLTCPYCNVVFRRGQMQEFRHHVDVCR